MLPPPTTTTTTSTNTATSNASTNDGNPRPQLSHRQSSTSSHVSQSLSEASSSQSHTHSSRTHLHHHHHPHKAQRHVVGGGGHGTRLGARNTSFGHNLNKLGHHTSTNSSSSKMPHDGSMSIAGTPTAHAPSQAHPTGAARDRPSHTRTKSGDSSGPGEGASSPRVPHANVKRNASAFVIARNHSHTALKKNYSSGQLPRNLSGKALNKAGGHRAPIAKRKHSGRSEKSVPASPVSPVAQQPTVRFALADEDAGSDNEENEWTEESASVSPNVTRDNTRHNSVILDSNVAPREMDHSAHDVTSGEESSSTVIHAPDDTENENTQGSGKRKGQEAAVKHINGESSYQASTRPLTLDADAITSRLLQRKAPSVHTAEPQISSVSAIVQPDAHDHRSLSHSQASTIAEGTPGRDLVSRFVDSNSIDGTPRDGNMLPHKESPPREGGELDASKRNKSAPSMADRGPISPVVAHARSASRRSGTSTPTDLPPSRTQQKLLLQRASSAIEPQKHIPAVLPRPGAAQLLGNGLSFPSAEGSTPAQVQALFAQVNKEYSVVRRYRNPVADAAARQREIPRPERRALTRRSSRNVGENGTSVDGHESPINSFKGRDERDNWPEQENPRRHETGEQHSRQSRHSHHASRTEEHDRERRHAPPKKEDKGHKSRVSFDLPSVQADDTDDEGIPSRSGSAGTQRAMGNEAYEICRRMWEMGEPAEVAGRRKRPQKKTKKKHKPQLPPSYNAVELVETNIREPAGSSETLIPLLMPLFRERARPNYGTLNAATVISSAMDDGNIVLGFGAR